MALSDLAVRQAKATGKAYTLPDLDGLSLAVTAAGGRTWHFRYYWAGKQKRMSLGTYPEVTLREARSLRGGDQRLEAAGGLGGLDDVGGRGGSRAEAKRSRGRKKDLVHEILQKI